MDMGSTVSVVGGLTQLTNINQHNMGQIKIIQSLVTIKKDILTSMATLSEPS